MGYVDVKGIILNRRNVFEDDQEIVLLSPDHGGLNVRAPHARKSQKTYCGRLEVPNYVESRIYRSREHSDWVMTDVRIEETYADLLRDEHYKHSLWPVLSLFRDLFPEGESPGDLVLLLRKALELLKAEFSPVSLVSNRLLVRTATRTGVDLTVEQCQSCGEEVTQEEQRTHSEWGVLMQGEIRCDECLETDDFKLPRKSLLNYKILRDQPWEQVCARTYSSKSLDKLEELLYRLFHFHFEISLSALRVRSNL